MAEPDHYTKFFKANIGLLCGRDEAAVKAGLIPDRITLIVDPDDEEFFERVYRINHHWLDDTFCVKGNRGAKWAYQLDYRGNEGQLKGTKIMRRVEGGDHDEVVGERLSTGEQGVVFGLHPSGKSYEGNSLPLLVIQPQWFRLPHGYYLSALLDEAVDPSRKRRFHSHNGPILDERSLQNKVPGPKGLQTACPACRNEGKDTNGDNLLIMPGGQFICSRFINDTALNRHRHNQQIYRLAGKQRDNYE